MPAKQDVTVTDRTIPIIAFFGTKGGVGKTTIMDAFATLVSRAASCPAVLLVDFDVHHRGLTVLRTKDRLGGAVKTIHEYLADDNLSFSTACDVTPPGSTGNRGTQFLIPSSNLAAEKVFATLAGKPPAELLDRLRGLLDSAGRQYQIDVILIDCGPVVDPLTATATMMSDMAFIIGQNEPISFQALQNYAIRIRDFFTEFDASKVRVLLNKVRGPILHAHSVYAAIPFTMEIVDYSEGLTNIDEIRLIYFDHCVRQIVASVLQEKYPELVPGADAILTEKQRTAIDLIDQYTSTRWYSRLRRGSMALWIGVAIAVIGSLLFVPAGTVNADEHEFLFKNLSWLAGTVVIVGSCLACVGAFFFRRKWLARSLVRIKHIGGSEGILELLTVPAGRKKFNAIQLLSEKTLKESPR